MSEYVTLTLEQLPEQLRPHLQTYLDAQKAAREARDGHDRAHLSAKGDFPIEKTQEAAHAAHAQLMERTAESTIQMQQHSEARHGACVARAREHLAAAEAELLAAAGHAALWASVRPGRPTVNGERGQTSEGRQRTMSAVSAVRAAAARLPEGVG